MKRDEELLGDTGIRWSAETIAKAEKLIADGKVTRDPAGAEGVFYVEGSKTYRVQTDGKTWITCTCPNGMNASRPHCYHTASVLMKIEQDLEALRKKLAE